MTFPSELIDELLKDYSQRIEWMKVEVANTWA